MTSVSVIIPSYNRLEPFRECLASLDRLDYPARDYEVIVVNDGSTVHGYDELDDLSRRYRYELHVMSKCRAGPASARNRALERAVGELTAFTNDDCQVEAGWLRHLVPHFDRADVGGVGGLVVSGFNDAFSHYLDFFKVMQPKIVDGDVKYLVTANACYRRSVLVRVKGFSEEITNPGGEDPDLSFNVRDLGYELFFEPRSIVVHSHRHSMRSFCRTFYNYGRGSGYLRRKWGAKAGRIDDGKRSLVLEAANISRVLRSARRLYRLDVTLLRSVQLACLRQAAKIAYRAGVRAAY